MSQFTTSWKDIVIGVLVGYVIIDIMMSYMLKRSMPSCFEKVLSYSKTQNGMMAIFIGVAIGIAVWYFLSQNTEGFKFEENEDKTEIKTLIN